MLMDPEADISMEWRFKLVLVGTLPTACLNKSHSNKGLNENEDGFSMDC